MESGSPRNPLLDPPPSKIAELVGTAIAILTLTLPTLLIARYSSSPTPASQLSLPASPAIVVRQPNHQPNGR